MLASSHHTVSVGQQSPCSQCWPAITIQSVTIQSVLASSHHTVSVGQQSPCSQCRPAITIQSVTMQSVLASNHHTVSHHAVSVGQQSPYSQSPYSQSPYPRVPCRPMLPVTERTPSPSSSCCPRPPSTRPTRCLGDTPLTAARCVYRAGSGEGGSGEGGGRGQSLLLNGCEGDHELLPPACIGRFLLSVQQMIF